MITLRQTVVPMMLTALLLASSAAFSDQISERQQASGKVVKALLQELGGKLKQEMKTNGPVAAISVCQDVAPAVANRLSLENGWRVTRVSSKPRNPLLGMTDEWEAETLRAFESRAASGESYATMIQAEVVEEAGKSYFRFMKPLTIKPVCLSCHGSDKQIPEVVKAELKKRYPYDKARNYKVGQLRGAVSIKQPMDTQ